MTVVFKKDSDETYRAPLFTNDTIVKEGDKYVVRKNGGSTVKYDTHGQLTEMKDKNENGTQLAYAGNTVSVTGPSGQKITLTIENGLVTKAVDSSSRTWVYAYSDKNLISVTNANGNTARFEYNQRGMTKQYDFSGYMYTENRFDDAGRVVWQKGTHGNIFEFEYDLFAKTTKVINHESKSTETYYYNELLQIVKHEFTDGTYELYEYDANGNKTKITRRDGQVIKRTYDDRGNLLTITSPNKSVTKYTYNALNQVTSTSIDDVLINEYVYSDSGNLLSVKKYLDSSTYIEKSYLYDAKGRMTQSTDAENQSINFEYSAGPNPIKIIDHEKNVTVISYDALNRVQTKTTIDGSTVYEYDYMNNVVKITDPSGDVTRQFYNNQNKIMKKVLPDQYNSLTDDGLGFAFEYDGADRITKTTDPIGNVNKVVLDSSGQTLKEVHPNIYDSNTNDGDGVVYEYDTENRLVRIIRPDSKQSRIKYDLMGNVVKSISFENYNPVSDNGPGMTYEYDSENRLIKITDAEGHVVQKNVYNSLGQIVKQIDGVGYKTASTDTDRLGTLYKRNLAGWITEIRTPISGTAENPKYQIKQVEYYNTGLKKVERIGREEVLVDGEPKSWLEISYTYNSMGKVLTVSDNTGAYTSFSYDALGRLTHKNEKMSDSENRLSGYTYNSKGLLETEWVEINSKYLSGIDVNKRSVKSYGYNGNGQLTSITLSNGERVNFIYDAAGRLIEERRSVTRGQVDVLNSNVWIKTPRELILPGSEAVFSLNLEPNGKMKSAEVILNIDSKLLNYIDASDVIGSATVEKMSENKLKVKLSKVESASEIAKLRFVTNEMKIGTGFVTIDSASYWTDTDDVKHPFTDLMGDIYNQNGPDMNMDGLVQVNDFAMVAQKQDLTHTDQGYDAFLDLNSNSVIDKGDLDQIKDWLFKTTKNPLEKVVNTGFLERTTNPVYEISTRRVDQVIKYEYDKAGNRTKVTDGEGTATTYEYDVYDNLIKEVDTEGNTNRYFYNADNQVIKTVNPSEYDSSKDDGAGTTYAYDNSSRLVTVTNALGHKVVTNTYSLRGEKVSVTDGDGNKTELEYDFGGRLISLTEPEAKKLNKTSKTYTYYPSGSVKTVTDGKGNTTTYIRDAWDRATEIQYPIGTEKYEYDYAGRTTKSVDSKGNATTYAYTPWDILYTVTDAELNTIKYEYNLNGQLVLETTQKGEAIVYEWYENGTLRSRTNNDTNDYEKFYYDLRGNVVAGVNNFGIDSYSYNGLGLLSAKSYNGKEMLKYTYNKNKRLESVTDKWSKVTNYDYDVAGNISGVSNGSGLLASYGYTNGGRLETVTYNNAVTTNLSYNTNGQLKTVSTQNGSDVLRTFGYSYDLNGNITNETRDSISYSFDYDTMNRLTNVLGSDSLAEVYEYDLAGNRTQMTRNGQITSYTYNTLNQLKNMTADGVLTEYAYDANGDIRTESINGNQTTYAFDGFRRLSSVNMSNGSVQQNYYNTENLRTGLVENGKFRGMLYSGSRVLAEYDGQDALINRYHIGKGIVASENANRLHYFHQNGHGDVSTITNASGNVVEKYSYSAYGELTSTNHRLDNRFLYSGEQLDPLTGDYYLRARMYRPSIGRFLAEDVYRGDGMNLYAYVGNNPLIYVDPSGWKKESTEGTNVLVSNRLIEEFIGQHQELTNVQFDAIRNGINSYAKAEELQNIGSNPITMFFEGAGSYVNENPNHPDGRYGAMAIVIKDSKIVYHTTNASTLPDNPDGVYYGNSDDRMFTIDSGIYEFNSGLHKTEKNWSKTADGGIYEQGKYPALHVNNNGNVSGTRASTPDDPSTRYSSRPGTGIHVHKGAPLGMQGKEYSGWSTGCLTVLPDDYAEFANAVGFAKGNNVNKGDPFYSVRGVLIVDKQYMK